MKKRSTDSSITSIVPPSNPGECCGPQARAFVEVTSEHILPEVRIKNLLWTIVRLQAKENHKVSGWTGFNIFVRNKVEVSQDVIRYLPTIDAPATDMAMVHKVLVKSLKTKTPSSSRTSLVFDQALYAKATAAVILIVVRMGQPVPCCQLLESVSTMPG